jgi:hypothetical protein
MEPRLHPGDLVIARSVLLYRPGDVALFHSGNGLVVHKLLRYSDGAWRTKGLNNTWVDPASVSPSALVGLLWFRSPGFSARLNWIARHPIPVGVICALLSALSFVPRRRRRVTAELADALTAARRERPVHGLDLTGRRLTYVCGIAAFTSLVALVLLHSIGRLGSAAGYGSIGGFVAAAAVTRVLVRGWRDGVGLMEPLRSRCVLAHELVLVDYFPCVSTPRRKVRSAIQMRALAHKYRLPVLHRITSGGDEFVLLTARRAYQLMVPRQPLIARSSPCQKSSRSLNFWSLPVAVRGRESRNSTRFGHL